MKLIPLASMLAFLASLAFCEEVRARPVLRSETQNVCVASISLLGTTVVH